MSLNNGDNVDQASVWQQPGPCLIVLNQAFALIPCRRPLLSLVPANAKAQ